MKEYDNFRTACSQYSQYTGVPVLLEDWMEMFEEYFLEEYILRMNDKE